MSNDIQISLRLPREIVDRLDRLVPELQKDPAWQAARVSRAFAARLALLRGLDALEAKNG